MTARAHTMGAPLPRVRRSAARTRALLAAFAVLAVFIAPQRAVAQTQLPARDDVIAMSSASELQPPRIRVRDGMLTAGRIYYEGGFTPPPL